MEIRQLTNAKPTKRTLVLGMGNTMLRDDGIGIIVARECAARFGIDGGTSGVEVRETNASGAALLTLLEGFDAAIVIDAIETREPQPGTIHVLDIGRFESTSGAAAPHGMNIYTALEFGRRCGLAMPEKVSVVAVEALDTQNVGEEMTREVAAAAPAAVETVCNLVDGVIN